MTMALTSEERNNPRIVGFPKLEDADEGKGVGYEIYKKMKSKLKSTAQIDGITGERDTFENLLKRCVRTAMKLKELGITQDDVISVCSPNTLHSCVPWIAATFLGVKVASLDFGFTLRDTVHLLRQILPKVVFVSLDALQLIENALKEINLPATIVVFGESQEHMPFSQFLQPRDLEERFQPKVIKNNKETILIVFSSGTSGLPKGICINHYTLLYQAYMLNYCGFNYQRFLSFTSLYSISGVLFQACVLLFGDNRVIYPKFDKSLVLPLVNKHKVWTLFLPPSHAMEVYYEAKDRNCDISSLTQMIIGGSALPTKHLRMLKGFFKHVKISMTYGQSELGGLCSIFKPNVLDMELYDQKLSSCGRPMPGFFFKIVDANNNDVILGPNEKGELRIKSLCMMNGYHKRDSANCWDERGWLITGDMAYFDEDGCLYIVDRIKELLKCKSRNVAPATIESVILTHPAVKTAIVVGIPHPGDGDQPMGVVILRKGYETVSADSIVQYVNEQVSDVQKLRAGVKIVQEIPSTATGKFQRIALRNMIINNML